jgi:hypothetical protein
MTILNYDKTACIPVPGFLLPFPLTILALVGTFLTIRDKKRNENSRFFPNQICMLSVLETVGLLSTLILAQSYGIRPTHYLCLAAFLFLYGLNLFFTLIYYTQMKRDSAFKYWEQEYLHSTYGVVSAGLCLNFKVFRLLYSRFQDRKQFNAVFTDELLLYRTIMFSSVFYILFVCLPILVACIFGLIHIQFGYQLQMFCLEMTIIETVILVIMSIELYKIRKHIQSSMRLYKVNPKEMMNMNGGNGAPNNGGSFAVLGGPDNYSEIELFDTQKGGDERTLLKLLQRINVKDAGKRKAHEYTTLKEIEELHEEEFRQH